MSDPIEFECICGCSAKITKDSPSELFASEWCHDRYYQSQQLDPSSNAGSWGRVSGPAAIWVSGESSCTWVHHLADGYSGERAVSAYIDDIADSQNVPRELFGYPIICSAEVAENAISFVTTRAREFSFSMDYVHWDNFARLFNGRGEAAHTQPERSKERRKPPGQKPSNLSYGPQKTKRRADW